MKARGNQCHGNGSLLEKSSRIDLGLALLSIARPPDETLIYEDIAAWCGCSWQAIYRIEHIALKKLRRRIGEDFRELLKS